MSRLIYARRGPLRRVTKELLALYGMEVPSETEVGTGLRIMHRGFGTVIHQQVRIGNDVTIFQNVTIGRADPWIAGSDSRMEAIVIGDGAMLCPGAVVVCKDGVLSVGAGSIIGANSVLTESTGPNEIWAGAPATKRGMRS